MRERTCSSTDKVGRRTIGNLASSRSMSNAIRAGKTLKVDVQMRYE